MTEIAILALTIVGLIIILLVTGLMSYFVFEETIRKVWKKRKNHSNSREKKNGCEQ